MSPERGVTVWGPSTPFGGSAMVATKLELDQVAAAAAAWRREDCRSTSGGSGGDSDSGAASDSGSAAPSGAAVSLRGFPREISVRRRRRKPGTKPPDGKLPAAGGMGTPQPPTQLSPPPPPPLSLPISVRALYPPSTPTSSSSPQPEFAASPRAPAFPSPSHAPLAAADNVAAAAAIVGGAGAASSEAGLRRQRRQLAAARERALSDGLAGVRGDASAAADGGSRLRRGRHERRRDAGRESARASPSVCHRCSHRRRARRHEGSERSERSERTSRAPFGTFAAGSSDEGGWTASPRDGEAPRGAAWARPKAARKAGGGGALGTASSPAGTSPSAASPAAATSASPASSPATPGSAVDSAFSTGAGGAAPTAASPAASPGPTASAIRRALCLRLNAMTSSFRACAGVPFESSRGALTAQTFQARSPCECGRRCRRRGLQALRAAGRFDFYWVKATAEGVSARSGGVGLTIPLQSPYGSAATRTVDALRLALKVLPPAHRAIFVLSDASAVVCLQRGGASTPYLDQLAKEVYALIPYCRPWFVYVPAAAQRAGGCDELLLLDEVALFPVEDEGAPEKDTDRGAKAQLDDADGDDDASGSGSAGGSASGGAAGPTSDVGGGSGGAGGCASSARFSTGFSAGLSVTHADDVDVDDDDDTAGSTDDTLGTSAQSRADGV